MLTREVPSFPLNYKNVITKAAHIYGRNFRGINNREKIHKICNPLAIDYLFTILGFLHLDAVFVGKKHMQLNAGSYVHSVLKLYFHLMQRPLGICGGFFQAPCGY